MFVRAIAKTHTQAVIQSWPLSPPKRLNLITLMHIESNRNYLTILFKKSFLKKRRKKEKKGARVQQWDANA